MPLTAELSTLIAASKYLDSDRESEHALAMHVDKVGFGLMACGLLCQELAIAWAILFDLGKERAPHANGLHPEVVECCCEDAVSQHNYA